MSKVAVLAHMSVWESVPADATGVVIVDLGAIRRNYERLRSLAPHSEAAGVVKADGYGLGVAEVARALRRSGCRTFFVATLGEAQRLRGSLASEGAQDTIYVLDGLLPGTARPFQENNLRPVLGSLPEIEEWAGFCRERGQELPAAVHIDTGMNRLGLALEDARSFAREFAQSEPDFELALLMTHYACADDAKHRLNAAQRDRFREVSALLPHIKTSLANSGGIFLGPDYHGDLVRPGVALYGGRASSLESSATGPVVGLYGRMAQLRWAERGETVGYGAAQTLKRRTLIATICTGYADGLFRALSASDVREGAAGYIADHRLPLLGCVSMDLMTFDATDVPTHLIERGGWIELMGERQTVDDLAAIAGTIGYEVLTSLGKRYKRIYVDE